MGNSNDTITLESKTYNKLKAQLEILTALVEGQNDIIQGRTTTIEETFNSIDKMIHQLDESNINILNGL